MTIERAGRRDVLTLTPLDKLDEPASLVDLRRDVTARLPRVDLTEVLLEVQAWTDFASRIPPRQRGRRPGRRPRPEPLRGAPGRGVQHRPGAAGPPRRPGADPRPAVLGPAELHPGRDHRPRPTPGWSTTRPRSRWRRPGAAARSPRPTACGSSSRSAPSTPAPTAKYFNTGRGDHLLQLHQRPVHRLPRHRRAGHDPRLAVHPGGPAGAADRPAPSRGHERHGRLQRPGLRPVLAAGLPVQPPAGRLRRGPVLADRPEGRLRGAERPGPAADQHPS